MKAATWNPMGVTAVREALQLSSIQNGADTQVNVHKWPEPNARLVILFT